ncbi:hypothetical protein [Paraglaciecola sp. L3A3]|uniref:hypothetical protein n=1 Tax=Paraglaciecola sp. L3A3 TaxID=2686358 RepID=UPI00131D85BF|nr:hypothetical protein [Paraglaciecola sp. L3A3]
MLHYSKKMEKRVTIICKLLLDRVTQKQNTLETPFPLDLTSIIETDSTHLIIRLLLLENDEEQRLKLIDKLIEYHYSPEFSPLPF